MTDFFHVKELSDGIKRANAENSSGVFLGPNDVLNTIKEKLQDEHSTTLSGADKKYIYALCLLLCTLENVEVGDFVEYLSSLGSKSWVYCSLFKIDNIERELGNGGTNYTEHIEMLEKIDAEKFKADYPDLYLRYHAIKSFCYFQVKNQLLFERNVNKGIEARNQINNISDFLLTYSKSVIEASLILDSMNSELLFINGKWNGSAKAKLNVLKAGKDLTSVLINSKTTLESLLMLLIITPFGSKKMLHINELFKLMQQKEITDGNTHIMLDIITKLHQNQIVDIQNDVLDHFTAEFVSSLRFPNCKEDDEISRFNKIVNKSVKCCIEQNIFNISKMFLNIQLDFIKPIINAPDYVTDEYITDILFEMILSGNLSAEIDQVNNSVVFTGHAQDSNEVYNGKVDTILKGELGWDRRINSFFEELNTLSKSIK